MLCTNCGTQIDEEAKFCTQCGAKVDGTAPQPPAVGTAPAGTASPAAGITAQPALPREQNIVPTGGTPNIYVAVTELTSQLKSLLKFMANINLFKPDASLTCRKNGVPIALKIPVGFEATVLSTAVSGNDIYNAGFVVDSNNVPHVVYWKNGKPTLPKSGILPPDGKAYAVAVDENNVYLAGFVNKTFSGPFAAWWKNGVLIKLTDGKKPSAVHAVTISGNDVYLAGSEGNTAVYLKNGIPAILPGGTVASSIAVSEGNTFIAGARTVSGGKLTAGEIFKAAATSLKEQLTTDIFDLMIDNCEKALYWKNGVPSELADSTAASSIAVYNGDVYIAGNQGKIAKYWKNGVPTVLTNGAYDAFAASVAVFNDDVYVAGMEKNSNNKYVAKYWINGRPVELTDGTKNAFSSSIFLVPQAG
jgi:hypothetical protein